MEIIDVENARRLVGPSRAKCQPSLWVMVASMTPAKRWLAIFTELNNACGAPRLRGSAAAVLTIR